MKPSIRWVEEDHPIDSEGTLVPHFFAHVAVPRLAALFMFAGLERGCHGTLGQLTRMDTEAAAKEYAGKNAPYAGPGWYFFDDLDWPDANAPWRKWGPFKTAAQGRRRIERWFAAWKARYVASTSSIKHVHEVTYGPWEGCGQLLEVPGEFEGEEPRVFCLHNKRVKPRAR